MNKSPLDKLVVKDSPGKITVADMRLMFETAVQSTETLRGLSLEGCDIGGQFHYIAPDTDHAWFGFALGLRCAERVELNGKFVSAEMRKAQSQ